MVRDQSRADAYLEKQDSKMSFNKVDIFVSLSVLAGASPDPYLKVLKKAVENCLITNSITAVVYLHPAIQEI